MINAENEIYTAVRTAVLAQYSTAFVTSDYTEVPATFPCVSLVERDNSTYVASLTGDGTSENHASLMYECNVYSALKTGRKAQCKAIMAIVDSTMQSIGFVRVGCSPMEVPNTDKTIYRMVARYRAVISKNLMIYRR